MNTLDLWMNSPLVIGGTLGLFIYVDVVLTRMGYRLKQAGYGKHFITDFYEMNPVHQDTIHKEQPFPVKRIVLWVGLVIVMTGLSFYYTAGELEILYGAMILNYVSILMQHVQNIFVFRHIIKHPDHLEGQIKIQLPYVFSQARVRVTLFGLLWFSLFFLFDRVFFFGGALVSGFQVFLYFIWERASLNKLQRQNEGV